MKKPFAKIKVLLVGVGELVEAMLRAVRAEQIFFKETICNAHSLKPQNLLHNYWRD